MWSRGQHRVPRADIQVHPRVHSEMYLGGEQPGGDKCSTEADD